MARGHFCKGLSVRHLARPFEQGCKTALGLPKSFQEFERNKAARRRWAFPRVSKNLKVAPFQSPPGQMAAFVSLLEAKAKDAGTAKNDYKQVETRSHSMIRCHPAQHGSLWD